MMNQRLETLIDEADEWALGSPWKLAVARKQQYPYRLTGLLNEHIIRL